MLRKSAGVYLQTVSGNLMTKKQLILFFSLTLVNFVLGQTKQELLFGDWVEIRREQRCGYVYTIGGAFNEPSIQLSFFKDSTGTFYNPQTPEPKSSQRYFLLGDTLLAFKGDGPIRITDVVTIDKKNLVIIYRWSNKRKDDNLDLKSYFIRKEEYLKLTKQEIDKLKAPTSKDKLYLDKINERRKSKQK